MATILGLDIGTSSVRGALVRTAMRKSQLVRYVEATIAPSANEEERKKALADAVKEVTGAFKPPAERVIAALPGEAASVRRVRLPSKAARRILEVLPFELESVVPFDPAESVLDHQPIETIGAEMSLLATVVPKERVRRQLDELAQVGVDARELAVGAVALDGLIMLVPALAVGGPHVLIGMEPSTTDVCVLLNGKCYFARTISVGANDITAGRQDVVAREIKQSVAAWRLDGGVMPESFFVAGEFAEREGAAQWLSELIGSPVQVLPLPAAPGADDGPRARYGRAAALAGRTAGRTKRLDLRQGEFAAKETMTVLRQHWPLFLACAAAILISFLFSSYARYAVLSSRNEELRAQLGEVTQRELGTAASSPEQAQLLLQRGVHSTDPMPRFDAYDALSAISAAIPERIVHDVQQLEIDLGDGEETGRFSLRGTVTTVEESEEVETAVRNYRIVRREGDREVRYQCFHEIEPGTASHVGERTAYRIEGRLQCVPEGTPVGGTQAKKRGNTRRGAH